MKQESQASRARRRIGDLGFLLFRGVLTNRGGVQQGREQASTYVSPLNSLGRQEGVFNKPRERGVWGSADRARLLPSREPMKPILFRG